MRAPDDSTTPARSDVTRMIPSWEHKHLGVWAAVRMTGGIVVAVFGGLMLAYGIYALAALVLAVAALLIASASLEMTVARSASARS